MKYNYFFFLLAFAFPFISQAQIADTLPVIVHVIHNGEAYGIGRNIDSVQVYSQFDVLNEDYNMLNTDVANTPAPFVPYVGNMQLTFLPALVDPSGNTLPERGIDRVNRVTMGWTAGSWTQSYIDANVKPATIWDPTHYLNIWIVYMANGLTGYPTFPANTGLSCWPGNITADPLRDGIVVDYHCFGRVGTPLAYPYNKGRTTTYLIGEWLGLRRLYQAGCGDDCVADTPITDFNTGGCATFPNVSLTCNNGPNGDMFMNFMSYNDDSCIVMFTHGQKARIDTTLTNGTYQSALRMSNTAVVTGIKNNSLEEHFMTIYPNPAHDAAQLNFGSISTGILSIYDATGKLVLEMKFENSKMLNLPLSNFSSGLYEVVVMHDHGISKEKLLIN